MSPQQLAAAAQAHMESGQFQLARDCLFAITAPCAQAVVIKMLLLVAESELKRTTLPSAAEFCPLRCVDERWPSRWMEAHVKCRIETQQCDGLAPKDPADKSRYACAHEAPWSDFCQHPAAKMALKERTA